MRLTQKQQQRIDRYLRGIEEKLGFLSPNPRERAVLRIRNRVLDEFRRFTQTPEDKDIEAVLAKCGSPDKIGEALRSGGGSGRPERPGRDRVWLGVCASIADTLGCDARAVRGIALALGLTGPISLLIYAAAYGVIHFRRDARTRDKVDLAKLSRSVLGALLGIGALFSGAQLAFWLILRGCGWLTGQANVELGDWGWLGQSGFHMFVWLLVFLFPVAIIGGLPVAGDWDRTAHKAVQAGLALYALGLSFGLACALVGSILELVREFGGGFVLS